MGYRTSATSCRVHLIHLHTLTPQQRAWCERLRVEAGRCWTDLVRAHVANREQGRWMSDSDLRAMTKGGVYHLHSQSIQVLGQKLLANVETARALRNQQAAAGLPVDAQYPLQGQALPNGNLERSGRTARPRHADFAEWAWTARSRRASARPLSSPAYSHGRVAVAG